MSQADPASPPEAGSAAPTERSRTLRILTNKKFVKLVGLVIIVVLVCYAFFIVLPSEISWSTVKADLEALSGQQVAALIAAGLFTMVMLGWAAKATLSGLTLYQGTESSATSQMTAFAMPPPADMLIRFSMYRTYGFSNEQAGVSVVIAMVARYVIVFFMPLIGLAAVCFTGQGTAALWWWLAGLAIALALALYLLLRIVWSESFAHRIGGWLQRVVTKVATKAHRTGAQDVETSVVQFGARTRNTVKSNAWSLILSNLAWGLSCGLIMALSMRFAGLTSSEVSAAYIALTTGVVMLVNMLPIPGKDALIVSGLSGLLALTTSAETNALGTALLLYRTMTWLLPMPVGAVFFFIWRFRVRRGSADTLATEK